MTFLDPRAMIECRLVSKYWRHHAIKPTVETEVAAQARYRYDEITCCTRLLILVRLREVYHSLQAKGVAISEDQIEQMLSSDRTRGAHFVRAAAIASKYGADLIVGMLQTLLRSPNWPQVKAEKK